jgi:AcrR family transcriptional regulator
MRTAPTRSWRGASAEDRRRERRERLIEAGLEVIGSEGWARTTVRGVCAEAGLTTRYFYEAFADREALLVAVFEHVRDEVTHAILTAFAQAPEDTRTKARAAIAAAFCLVTDDPRKGRVLLLEAANDERLQQLRQESMAVGAGILSSIAQSYFGGDTVDPTDAELSALALVGAQAELAVAYLSGRVDVDRERLIDHITELHLAAASVSSLSR